MARTVGKYCQQAPGDWKAFQRSQRDRPGFYSQTVRAISGFSENESSSLSSVKSNLGHQRERDVGRGRRRKRETTCSPKKSVWGIILRDKFSFYDHQKDQTWLGSFFNFDLNLLTWKFKAFSVLSNWQCDWIEGKKCSIHLQFIQNMEINVLFPFLFLMEFIIIWRNRP